MKAMVGDRLVVSAQHVDGPVRDGEIVEVKHADGSPPYLVRWSASGQTGLFFPGADAHLEHMQGAGTTGPEPEARRTMRRWTVQLDIMDTPDGMTARAELSSGAPSPLTTTASASRSADPQSGTGAEEAAGRALQELGALLLATGPRGVPAG